ncbi:MAG: MAPEG family protein [Betaproteobacteria bacterium]|nr:MAPEG family protein [Betaproteobacteria bacterium]
MTVELKYLALVTTLTALMWIPYILNMIMVRGVADAVGYPENPKPMAPWATRMKAAHYNAVENLVVFAALVVVAHVVGVKGEATALACVIYFWARVVHLLAYTFRIPWVRTLAFVVGFGCQMTLAYEILA